MGYRQSFYYTREYVGNREDDNFILKKHLVEDPFGHDLVLEAKKQLNDSQKNRYHQLTRKTVNFSAIANNTHAPGYTVEEKQAVAEDAFKSAINSYQSNKDDDLYVFKRHLQQEIKKAFKNLPSR